MKKILIFLVVFFPLLAGATNGGHFDPSSTDLTPIEVINSSVDIEDGRVHRWQFAAFGSSFGLNIVKIRDGLYQIYSRLINRGNGEMLCNIFLDHMRSQPGWKWYEKDGITEIDGYSDYPVRTTWCPDGVFYIFMNVYICNIQSVIEAHPKFVYWEF